MGEPIETDGRPTRAAIDSLTQVTSERLRAMVADAPELTVPGRFGRWLTDVFNDWPEGSRDAALAAELVANEAPAPVPAHQPAAHPVA